MSRFALLLLSLIVFGMAFSNIAAQSDEACSGELVAATISQYVADIKASEDPSQISSLLEQLQDELDSVLRGCRNSGGTASSTGPGSGTRQDPFAFSVEGDTGEGFTVQINSIIRPASDIIQRENYFNDRPGLGQEYVLVNVTIRCAQTSERCETGYLDFELVGDNGVVSDLPLIVVPDELQMVSLFGGGEQSGNLAFLIQSDDTNLNLLYRANMFDNQAVFFRAEPSMDNGIQITSSSNINIRNSPSTNGGVVGSLPSGTAAIAFGRNVDGTWLQVSSGWVFAELVTTDGDIQSLPVTAQ